MKKLIFTAVSFLAIGSAIAQQSFQRYTPEKYIQQGQFEQSPLKRNATLNKADAIEAWYSHTDFMLDVAGLIATPQLTASFIAHDSLAKYIYNDDTIRYNTPSMATASILDPKDDLLDLTQNYSGLKLTQYTSYTVDSIGFRYLYCRPQDSTDDGMGGKKLVVDTLFLYSFKTPGISEYSFTGGPHLSETFGTMAWNKNTRYPTGQVGIDTVLLTTKDTSVAPDTNWVVRAMQIGLNTPISVPKVQNGVSNNLVGFVVVFKSGIVYDTSFTAYYAGTGTKPPAEKRVNYFGTAAIVDAGANPYKNVGFYSSSLSAINDLAYPNTIQAPPLYPDYALYTRPRWIEGYYRITALNTGINDISNDQFAMGDVYPNPAQSNGTASISFSVKNTSNVSVAIYNIAGVQVKSAINKSFAAGEHTEEISLGNLKSGIYFVNMTVNGSTITKKLTIVE